MTALDSEIGDLRRARDVLERENADLKSKLGVSAAAEMLLGSSIAAVRRMSQDAPQLFRATYNLCLLISGPSWNQKRAIQIGEGGEGQRNRVHWGNDEARNGDVRGTDASYGGCASRSSRRCRGERSALRADDPRKFLGLKRSTRKSRTCIIRITYDRFKRK